MRNVELTLPTAFAAQPSSSSLTRSGVSSLNLSQLDQSDVENMHSYLVKLQILYSPPPFEEFDGILSFAFVQVNAQNSILHTLLNVSQLIQEVFLLLLC